MHTSRIRQKGRNDEGISQVQGTLALLAALLIIVLVVKAGVADGIVSGALDFGKYRVWGWHNDVSPSAGNVSNVTISSPADGDNVYADNDVRIEGKTLPGEGRRVSFVYYTVDNATWEKADVTNDTWKGGPRRYPEGAYRVQAIAYDDAGDESPAAVSSFNSIMRMAPDSEHIENNIPVTMTAGERYDVYAIFRNTGNLPWNRSTSCGLSVTWSGSTQFYPVNATADVIPSGSYMFIFPLNASASIGNYPFSARIEMDGFGGFGEELTLMVSVVPSYFDAKVISVDMPSVMSARETRLVSITMQNTGTATWRKAGAGMVRLEGVTGSISRLFNNTNQFSMPTSVPVRTGGNCTFSFLITAPTAGLYHPAYRMVNASPFGETAMKAISVVAPTPVPSPTPDGNPGYIATGRMMLVLIGGETYTGCIEYLYDGPLHGGLWRASFYERWEIGGPNGHYHIYKPGCTGGLDFEMSGGGERGTARFVEYERIDII